MRFVFASYGYNGTFDEPEAWLERIDPYVKILEELAIKHEVLSIEQINFEGNYQHKAVNHHFKRYSKTALRFFAFELNFFIKNLHADVIVIQGFHKPLQLILLRLIIGKKSKIVVQNRAEKPFIGFRKTFQQLADRCIDAYLFASKPLGLTWVEQGNLSSASKIHEVMCLTTIFNQLPKEIAFAKTKATGEPVFLWVGRLNANKDPLTVIGAFLKFTEINPKAKLYVIYQTTELLQEIQNLLANHSNQHQIVLVGEITHKELSFWFNSADFLISGSHYEGGGLVLAEAMSCGCIPIVTDIFSFRMITNNGECGLLYEAGNQQALLDQLIETQKLNLEEKKTQCLTYFQTNLSTTAIAKKMEEIAYAL